jgi:hypothetical protein
MGKSLVKGEERYRAVYDFYCWYRKVKKGFGD